MQAQGLDNKYKQAEIAKIYADISGTNIDPNTASSYATYYAATGNLSAIPEQYRAAAIAAAQGSQPTGTVVDANTGVPGTLPTEAKTKIDTRSQLLQRAQELATLYGPPEKNLSSGFFSSVIGSVLPDKTRQAYNDARKDFVDLIGRARTGAVINPSEEAFYKSLVPDSNFDFPGGINKGQQLQNLVDRLNTDLNTTLQSYNASIVGQMSGSAANEYQQLLQKATPEQRAQLNETSLNWNAIKVDIPQSSRLSFVNNNPGNLKYVGQPGAEPGENGFARFLSPVAGVQALARQIALDASRGLTLYSFISKFAPPTENDTKKYIQQIANATSTTPSTPIGMIPLPTLLKAIAYKESKTRIIV
jgi:hypothetical protein